jgi:putative transposase
MTKPIHPLALFRLAILGELASRERLSAGELKSMLLSRSKVWHKKPNGDSVQYSAKAIERWYYVWRRFGIDGLNPKKRSDSGYSTIAEMTQQFLLDAKREAPSRSLRTLIHLAELKGIVAHGQLSRASVHRLLARQQLSKRTHADSQQIERRSFEALHAGDTWYGDVLHGPKIDTPQGMQKTYLVTLMDDASRLICHSGFYLNETAVSVEYALKEALLKRGMPKKLVIDNGAAYRAETLQKICARLEIQLIYGRPYEPESKGKLERWHRTLRESFLAELQLSHVRGLDEMNAKLWVWVEHYYHRQPHSGLANHLTPLERWQQELSCVRSLGLLAKDLDTYFYHRIKRQVRKDGTLSYEGMHYEVPHALASQSVYLVIEPHQGIAQWVESLDYKKIGEVYPLDKKANYHRRRQRPELANVNQVRKNPTNLVDTLFDKAQQTLDITQIKFNDEE